MNPKARIHISLTGLGAGVDHIEVTFDEIPTEQITPELRHQLLQLIRDLTVTFMGARPIAGQSSE